MDNEEKEVLPREPAQGNTADKTWWHSLPNNQQVMIVVALISFFGTILVLIGTLTVPIIEAWANGLFAGTNSPTPTHTPTIALSPTFTPSFPPTPSLTPTPECWNSILLLYSELGGIGESKTFPLTTEGLKVDISNDENGSGVFFKFNPALDVRGFTRLELSGASNESFTFLVEYKVLDALNQPEIVRTSNEQDFSGNYLPQTISIPIHYDGTINELVINIPNKDDATLLTIKSICFK